MRLDIILNGCSRGIHPDIRADNSADDRIERGVVSGDHAGIAAHDFQAVQTAGKHAILRRLNTFRTDADILPVECQGQNLTVG